MSIPTSLLERLEKIAEREGKQPEEVLAILLDNYEMRKKAINNFIGYFDDDVSDLSSTVNETLRKRFGTDDDSTA